MITPNAIINRLGTRSSVLNSRHFHLQVRSTVERAWAACSGTNASKPHKCVVVIFRTVRGSARDCVEPCCKVPSTVLASEPFRYATSNKTSGCLTAIFSNTFAGPDGFRLPCSQFCNVSGLIPESPQTSIATNPACANPHKVALRVHVKHTPRLQPPTLDQVCLAQARLQLFKSSFFTIQIPQQFLQLLDFTL